MNESHNNHISVDEIIQKIKAEVARKNQNPEQKPTLVSTEAINNEPFINTALKGVYIMSDFTKYADEAFINYAYKHILQRDADHQGRTFYLTKLRNGTLSKEDIILKLHFSKEGRHKNVKILGAKKRLLRMLVYKLPLLGFVLELMVELFKLPKTLRKLNTNLEQQLNEKANQRQLEALQQSLTQELQHKVSHSTLEELHQTLETKANQDNLNALQKSLTEELNSTVKRDTVHEIHQSLIQELNNKVNRDTVHEIHQSLTQELNNKVNHATVHTLQEALNNRATLREFELYLQTVNYAKESMQLSQQNMQNLINEAKKRLPDTLLNPKELTQITQEEQYQLDAFYVAFEDRFRGTKEDVKNRLHVYLPYLENLDFKQEDIKLLDVGCGRGEWLELLQERGYKQLQGLDLNRIMVAHSQALGLSVIESDVIAYLSNLEDESLCVITGFHIIEHLPFKILMKLFEESYRVLKPGGMIIFETPNPENMLVGACNFYSDPTHINPLVPFSTQFMAEHHKFQKTEIKRLHHYSDYFETTEQNPFISSVFYNEMDYAIIGYKP